jgi:hypothetical protein
MKDSIMDQRVRSPMRACQRPSAPTGVQIIMEPVQILTAAAVILVVCGATLQGNKLFLI